MGPDAICASNLALQAPRDRAESVERFLLRVPLGALGRGRLGLGLLGRGLARVAALPLGLTSWGRRCTAVGEQIGELLDA